MGTPDLGNDEITRNSITSDYFLVWASGKGRIGLKRALHEDQGTSHYLDFWGQ